MALSSEEDRATATGNVKRKFRIKFGRVVFATCQRTDGRTDMLIAILHTPTRRRSNDADAADSEDDHYSLLTTTNWWRSPAVEHRSLAGLLSLSCARLAADAWVTTYVGKPSDVSQPTRPTQPFILSGSINE